MILLDKNNIITIIAVVLLIGAILFSFDYGTTGKAVSSQDLVLVSPSVVKTGEYITIEILPSARGINKIVKIFDSANLRKAQIRMQCGTFRCIKSVSDVYKTGSDWESGVYYLGYFNYNTNAFEKVFFTIE